MEKICFTVSGESEPTWFYVIEQTRIGGVSYLLVTDQESGDSEAWILKDLSSDGDADAIYEFVEDEILLLRRSPVWELTTPMVKL